MKTNWTAPQNGTTIDELLSIVNGTSLVCWERDAAEEHLLRLCENHPLSTPTNLLITTSGVIEPYDLLRIAKTITDVCNQTGVCGLDHSHECEDSCPNPDLNYEEAVIDALESVELKLCGLSARECWRKRHQHGIPAGLPRR